MAGGEASAPAGGGAAKSRTGRKLTASKRLPSVRAAADEQASNAEAPDVGDRGEPGPTAGAGGRVAGGATQGGGSDSSTAGGGRGGSRGAAGGGAESSARGGHRVHGHGLLPQGRGGGQLHKVRGRDSSFRIAATAAPSGPVPCGGSPWPKISSLQPFCPPHCVRSQELGILGCLHASAASLRAPP